jgi:hypothetical protein
MLVFVVFRPERTLAGLLIISLPNRNGEVSSHETADAPQLCQTECPAAHFGTRRNLVTIDAQSIKATVPL